MHFYASTAELLSALVPSSRVHLLCHASSNCDRQPGTRLLLLSIDVVNVALLCVPTLTTALCTCILRQQCNTANAHTV